MTLLSDIASTEATPPSIASAINKGLAAAREASRAALRGAQEYHRIVLEENRIAQLGPKTQAAATVKLAPVTDSDLPQHPVPLPCCTPAAALAQDAPAEHSLPPATQSPTSPLPLRDDVPPGVLAALGPEASPQLDSAQAPAAPLELGPAAPCRAASLLAPRMRRWSALSTLQEEPGTQLPPESWQAALPPSAPHEKPWQAPQEKPWQASASPTQPEQAHPEQPVLSSPATPWDGTASLPAPHLPPTAESVSCEPGGNQLALPPPPPPPPAEPPSHTEAAELSLLSRLWSATATATAQEDTGSTVIYCEAPLAWQDTAALPPDQLRAPVAASAMAATDLRQMSHVYVIFEPRRLEQVAWWSPGLARDASANTSVMPGDHDLAFATDTVGL